MFLECINADLNAVTYWMGSNILSEVNININVYNGAQYSGKVKKECCQIKGYSEFGNNVSWKREKRAREIKETRTQLQ